MARTYMARTRIDREPDASLIPFPVTAGLAVNRQELVPEGGFERYHLIAPTDATISLQCQFAQRAC